jgi:hypothetical protein
VAYYPRVQTVTQLRSLLQLVKGNPAWLPPSFILILVTLLLLLLFCFSFSPFPIYRFLRAKEKIVFRILFTITKHAELI